MAGLPGVNFHSDFNRCGLLHESVVSRPNYLQPHVKEKVNSESIFRSSLLWSTRNQVSSMKGEGAGPVRHTDPWSPPLPLNDSYPGSLHAGATFRPATHGELECS